MRHTILLIAVLLSATVSWSQSGQKMMLNHIAIYVSDLNVSTDFYEQVIGLAKIDEPFKDGLHAWYGLGAAGQIHLIQGAEKNIQHNKNNHLCFSVKSIDDFVALLKKKNIEFSNWPGKANEITVRPDGVKQIWFQDPDGYWIEVNNDYTGK